jgi:YD repeat-containing protein
MTSIRRSNPTIGTTERPSVKYSSGAAGASLSIDRLDYDGNGNRTRVTRLDGTSDAVTTTFTYEPQFNQLASVTDPLSHTTSFSYDQNGNLTTATDPLAIPRPGVQQRRAVISATDSLNNSVQFGYFGWGSAERD